MQPGDVLETYADVDDLMRDVGFRPRTPIEVGLARFVDWYRQYHERSVVPPSRPPWPELAIRAGRFYERVCARPFCRH